MGGIAARASDIADRIYPHSVAGERRIAKFQLYGAISSYVVKLAARAARANAQIDVATSRQFICLVRDALHPFIDVIKLNPNEAPSYMDYEVSLRLNGQAIREEYASLAKAPGASAFASKFHSEIKACYDDIGYYDDNPAYAPIMDSAEAVLVALKFLGSPKPNAP